MGLFGLAYFLVGQKAKEIGIRKVLGASVPGIAASLANRFLKLVFVSIALASPISWLLMHKWLQNFAYRLPIAWWIFAIAGATALLIALITVSFQSIKAAMTNPINSLRSE